VLEGGRLMDGVNRRADGSSALPFFCLMRGDHISLLPGWGGALFREVVPCFGRKCPVLGRVFFGLVVDIIATRQRGKRQDGKNGTRFLLFLFWSVLLGCEGKTQDDDIVNRVFFECKEV
jgi:hypothetical protein